jgi:hypothetical protein
LPQKGESGGIPFGLIDPLPVGDLAMVFVAEPPDIKGPGIIGVVGFEPVRRAAGFAGKPDESTVTDGVIEGHTGSVSIGMADPMPNPISKGLRATMRGLLPAPLVGGAGFGLGVIAGLHVPLGAFLALVEVAIRHLGMEIELIKRLHEPALEASLHRVASGSLKGDLV